MDIKFSGLFLLLLVLFLPPSFALNANVLWEFPLVKAKATQIPDLVDDRDFALMEVAIERQVAALDRKKLSGKIKIGAELFDVSVLKISLLEFKEIVAYHKLCLKHFVKQDCLRDFNRNLRQAFNFYQPDNQEQALFTGYYTPVHRGSLLETDEFSYAIYKRPLVGQTQYTRTEIDLDKSLSGLGLELFHIDNPFDLYLLHVEGGGKVEWFEEGKVKSFYLTYNGTNKKSFNFISKYMKSKGYIQDGSIESQRKFLDEHPEKWREVFDQCPSYVFFKKTLTPPHGVWGMPLTDGRSIAQDNRYYKMKGLLSFVQTRVLDRSFSRFMIDQDTGGAIKGKARADLYIGEGKEAKLIGDNLHNKGNILFLIKKI